MNKIREYLITAGISLVLVLSVCIAYAQAPEPEVLAPEALAPEALAPEALAPEALAPEAPEQDAPAPEAPDAAVAAPEDPAPEQPVQAAEPEPEQPAPAADPIPDVEALRERLENNRALRAAGRTRGAAPAGTRTSPLTRSTPGVRTITPSSVRMAQDADDSVITPSDSAAGEDKSIIPALKFDNTASDIVLMAYAEQTGKTLLIAPDAPKANITLRSQPDIALTAEEFIEAIEVVLSMNGIVLEPFGEKFVKVLARKSVRTDGIQIIMTPPKEGHPEKTRVVSQMIQLLHITIDEAKKAIEGFKKPDGMIQSFERTNSLLVTDTQENVNRMLEIIKFIDQPIPVTEEVFTRTINFAKADDIKKRLEEIVAESQKATSKTEVTSKTSGSPGMTSTTTPASSIAARLAALRGRGRAAPEPEPDTSPNAAIDALVSDADRGMVRGKVQIMADERTNQLIIITRKENMDFFEKIIDVLDVETTPDVKVDVMRLEYADAEEVSTMLNDLIGNTTSKKDDGNAPVTAGNAPAKSTSLADAARARLSGSSETTGEGGVSKLGQLSKDNIKILADKRTNAIVMMGSTGDLAAITAIIKSMDIKLSQVLIETVVLEVALKDDIETGINWVRRINNHDNFRYTVGGGGTSKAGTTTLFGSEKVTEKVPGKDEDGKDISTDVTKTVDTMAGDYLESMSNPLNGIEYFMTLKSLRLDAVIQAAQSDSRSRVLSSPILLTVDNKEASIEATETRYMYKGMRYMGYSSGAGGGGSYEPDIEQRDVGLTVKVTPRINPEGNVIMTIEETFEDVLGDQIIDGQAWPTVTSRKLSADVSVGHGETVILGGLVKAAKSNSESGIPILKDIPYIGKYLFGSVKKSEQRSELLVFLTPYVINSADDMRKEARRRKDYLDATDVWTKGWSDSDLADPVPMNEMKIRLERKKALESRWKEYAGELESLNDVDARITEEREKALKIMHGGASATNAVPPKSGAMKVELGDTILEYEGESLPEDKVPDPQRPAIEAEKRSWWKRLFSSEEDS